MNNIYLKNGELNWIKINMKKNQYNVIKILAVIFLCVLGGFAFHHFNHKTHEQEEAEFEVTNPWRQDLEIKKSYVAQIRAVQHIELRSMEKGYLQNIYVDEGQFVKKGQKMFQIMPLLVEAELKKAKAEYQLSKIEYDNTLILERKNVVSANELALAKSRLDKARAEMDLKQAHLDLTTIKAPFNGIMDRFNKRLGSLVDEGELLTTLSDNSKMWVYFNMSEADYLNYMEHKKTGKTIPVELVLANGDLFNHQGVIDTIEADFDNETGNVAFRASFPNPEGLLRYGETGTVMLTEKFDNALVVPQKTTFEVLDKKFIYVVNSKDEIESRQITIKGEVPDLFIIDSGLDDNDKILLEGLGKINSGQKIKAKYQDNADVRKNLKLSVEQN